MSEKCAIDGCRNDVSDLGLCRKHLRQAQGERAEEREASPVGASVDRGYHARAAFAHVEAATGEAEFTAAYRRLAVEGARLERDDPLPVVVEEEHPLI